MKKLVVQGLNKSFGMVQALKDVNLELEAGKMLAVLGPSGCGKTTLLRSIAGFETPNSGKIFVDERCLFDGRKGVKPEQRKIGYVPQHGVLFPHLSVEKNIAFGLHSMGLSRAKKSQRVQEMLELVGMPGLSQRMPHELSGGQQQRIALARALAPSPSLVLLDEPFSALDAGLRQSLREEVRLMLAQIDATAIIVTHDQEEALSMADSVAVMRQGACIQVASPTDIYQYPADVEVAQFVGEATLIPASLIDQSKTITAASDKQIFYPAKEATGDSAFAVAEEIALSTVTQPVQTQACCALGELSLSSYSKVKSGQALVMIRPEQFLLCPPETAQITGQIQKITYCGHSTLLQILTHPNCGAHEIQVRLNGAQKLNLADIVHLCVDGDVMAYPLLGMGSH